jgi:hypothetical protein
MPLDAQELRFLVMSRCRPFKLIDAMILIGIAALGMAEMRPGWNQFRAFWASINQNPPSEAYGRMVQSSLMIAFLNLAVGYVWIRLISTRLPWRDLIRQPGMLVLILMIASALLYMVFSAVVKPSPSANMIVGLALGLSWVAACLRYRSSAEPGWIEWLGRVFGAGLVVAVATSYS